MSVTVYHYPKCSTCRRALAWLDHRGIEARRVDIVERPPSRALLARGARAVGIKKMFNTSGQSYRQGGFKDRLPRMTEAEALAALAADGKLIKRPILVADDSILVGFVEDEWVRALPRS